MADSSSEEKTEKPSAQKLRKAREEGQLSLEGYGAGGEPVCGVCGDLQ